MIAWKVGFKASDDGSFWMSYDDFLQIYNGISICDRTTIQNLHLSVDGGDGILAKFKLNIAKGCITGCFTYWLCCRGLRNIYFGRVESGKSEPSPGQKCLAKLCPCIHQSTGEEFANI